jgi:hypothetical protein
MKDEEDNELAGVSRNNPFTVPDGYFDQLPSVIMDRCRLTTAKKESFLALLLSQYRVRLTVFSSAILAAGIGIVFYFYRSGNENYRVTTHWDETMISSIPDSVLYSHLNNHINSISEANITDELPQNNDFNSSLELQADTTNHEIINYLINNNLSNKEIEDEL